MPDTGKVKRRDENQSHSKFKELVGRGKMSSGSTAAAPLQQGCRPSAAARHHEFAGRIMAPSISNNDFMLDEMRQRCNSVNDFSNRNHQLPIASIEAMRRISKSS
jgi:hypothetical protein